MPPAQRRDRSSSRKPYLTVDDVVEDPEKNWNALYLRSQIATAEDELSLQESWQRFGRWVVVLGMISLWSVAIVGDALGWKRLESWNSWLYLGALLFSLAAPVAVYIQFKKTRKTRLSLKRLRILLRDKLAEQDKFADHTDKGPLIRQRRYRNDLPDIVAQMREQSARLRAKHNRFQAVIIVGSILASAITTASVSFEVTRWISVVVTASVGLAAGFTGYYKFHDNSYNLQQTADAIEREYESVDLRVGRYANLGDEAAYALFADTVERLRDEQNKRQQQLDQPVEAARGESPGPE
jgi:hypothetical protein